MLRYHLQPVIVCVLLTYYVLSSYARSFVGISNLHVFKHFFTSFLSKLYTIDRDNLIAILIKKAEVTCQVVTMKVLVQQIGGL